ncbi:hypothetical protein RDI58_028968 [Solanum bulbocastanum]|uniref:Uncharacterized protein n=1 Tax=Solanum bulbocastanum TaxID=147425 RepID=A0AAN8SSV5_SOLBU
MNVEIAKLAYKLVDLPLALVSDSLMNLFNMPPITQPFRDISGALDMPDTSKGKEKKKTFDIEVPHKTYREKRRRLKKSRRVFEKAARENEA